MKITQNLIFSYMFAITAILIFFNVYKFGIFEECVQYTECIVNSVDVISSIVIFYNIRKKYKSFLLLPLVMIFLLLMDIIYLVAFYFKMNNGFVINFICNILWYASTISGLILILLKFVYGKKESYFFFASFAFIALVIIFFFAPNFIKYLHNTYYSEDLSAHIIIFYLCILLIIATQNKYVLLIISGLCIVEIGNSAMTECYLENTLNKIVYGEFCFFIGLFVLSVGMLNIIRCKLYNPDVWFFNSTTIRNKFSFLIFSIAMWSFIIACIIMKEFGNINANLLVFIPAIGMFYSMITAIFSIIISKIIEKPFLQIQAKIKSLFYEGNTSYPENINLMEFQQLNNFIVDAYQYKATLEKHIISMATRIAHDIKSPLQIIENLIKNQNNNKIDFSQEQFLKQINKINYISKSLLKENKIIIENESYGIQSLYCIVKDLISDKQIEWNAESSIIDFEYKPQQIIWLNNEQMQIKTILSNLLNNAFEASNNKTNIKLIINLENNNIIIRIQDFGCGICEKDLDSILNGKSLKVNGNGIGLSSARKFMFTINGQLTIDSKINHGTTIKLEFPMQSFPKQFATQIKINTKHIVAADDNFDIIDFWQEYVLFNTKNKEISYYLNFFKLKNYLSQNIRHDDITFLLDYNILGEKSTGIDIIKEFNLKNVYLITNYAEDIKLQNEVMLLDIKLVPKAMLQIMLINKAIN